MTEAKKTLNCPCPAECERHGYCKICREHHKAKGTQPHCDKVGKSSKPQEVDPSMTGRDFRLMDYAAGAG
jgi:hypothetical protein